MIMKKSTINKYIYTYTYTLHGLDEWRDGRVNVNIYLIYIIT